MKDRQKVVEFIALKSLESMSVKALMRFYLDQTEESLINETDEELVSYLDDWCVDEDGNHNDEEFLEYTSYLEV